MIHREAGMGVVFAGGCAEVHPGGRDHRIKLLDLHRPG